MKVKLFIIKLNEPTHSLFSPFFPEGKKRELPWLFARKGVASCNVELLLCTAALTPFDGHAARVALVAKGGTTPDLVLHKNS